MTMQNRPRIAIFGTFDVENYGDLLFPLIARHRLTAAGIDVVPVSPTNRTVGYPDTVQPLSQAEFAADPAQVDAVLIGGGNIVHFRDFAVEGYPASAYQALWIGATAQAVLHDLPVIWNAPGVLALRAMTSVPDWLGRVADAADRLAVRDQESAVCLEHMTGRRPVVMPDSALDIAQVWPTTEMAARLQRVRARLGIGAETPLVALHVKERSLAGMGLAEFATSLRAQLRSCNAKAVLLALGRCHGDHQVAQALHAMAPDVTYAFQDADHLQDIAAVIAGARAYLGASLHGHITAAAYGVRSRLVAVPALHKFAGQAALMGRGDEVAPSWTAALDDLPHLLSQGPAALPETVHAALDHHWQEVARIVRAGRTTRPKLPVFGAEDPETALTAALAALGNTTVSQGRVPTKSIDTNRVMKGPSVTNGLDRAWDRAEVDRLILAGKLQDAADRISAKLGETPNFLPARMAEVRLTEAQGNTALAEDMAERLSQTHPANPWVWRCHLQALAAAGQQEKVTARFLDGLEKLGIEEAILTAVLNDILPKLSIERQVDLLKAAIAKVPGHATLELRLAMRAGSVGDYKLAVDLLNRVEGSGMALPPYAQRVKNQLLPFSVSTNEATDIVQARVRDGANDIETLCQLSRLAANVGRFELSLDAIQQAVALHPQEWRTLYRLNRMFVPQADCAAIFSCLKAISPPAAQSASWILQFALFALRIGEEALGRKLLAELSQEQATADTALMLLDALDALGPAAPRPGVVDDAHMRIVPVPGAKGTIVIFCHFLGISYVHERYFDALLCKVPANVIYLRDPHGQIFLKGIPGFWPNESAMQVGLTELLAKLGGGKVLTLGNSAAGYAALRYGLAIGAHETLSLAGFVTPGVADPAEPAHSRRGMDELFQGGLDTHDLRPILKGRPDYRLVHFIGDSYAPDLTRAKAMAGIPNAEVRVLKGVNSHHAALPAIADGSLSQVLQDAFSGLP